MRIVLMLTTILWWTSGIDPATAVATPSDSPTVPNPHGGEALHFARQAESSAAEKDLDRFTREVDQALDIALKAGAQAPSHRLAEGIHALMEARTLALQGNLDEAREDLQSAIVWLSRAAGLPDGAPSPGDRRQPKLRKDASMDHFVTDIEDATIKNEDFRRVLYTAPNSQLVLMMLKPGEEIGAETHDLDQFIRVEAGRGTAQLNGKDYPIQDGSALVIPAGTRHNVINTGQEALKLYTLYSPPEHRDGTVHHTKQDAEADRQDHYDGRTTAMMQESAQ